MGQPAPRVTRYVNVLASQSPDAPPHPIAIIDHRGRLLWHRELEVDAATEERIRSALPARSHRTIDADWLGQAVAALRAAGVRCTLVTMPAGAGSEEMALRCRHQPGLG